MGLAYGASARSVRPIALVLRAGGAAGAAGPAALADDDRAAHVLVVMAVVLIRPGVRERRAERPAGLDVAGVPADVERDRVGVLAAVHPGDGRPHLDVEGL